MGLQERICEYSVVLLEIAESVEQSMSTTYVEMDESIIEPRFRH